ncbi:zinc ribbon domain protein [bacterium BMS3Abin05]|nr:zinc ribbon domain protein [bacterium BMS3Abin05]GBE27522.1 zinc ribbon domain protein [bacterium BMS3Bbin03]HDZ11413.1 zinc ribbon domain-containing protein [Bacteroidota bacterium]
MPIYEYRCLDCGKRTNFLFLKRDEKRELKCRWCGGTNMVRAVSRFATVQSEEDRFEKLSDPSAWGGLDENDPKSVAKFMKKMGSELGEEMDKEELDQLIDEAEREAYNMKKGGAGLSEDEVV